MKRTTVIFRKFKEGDIVAIFPYDIEHGYYVNSYMHIGQHGSCDIGIVYTTKLATEEEYKPLLNELISIGYDDLKVGKKIHHSTYIKAVEIARNKR